MMRVRFIFSLLSTLLLCGWLAAQTTPKVLPVAEFYEGGQEALLADIQKTMTYPPVAKRNRVQGECIVSFTLESDGKITNQKLIKGIGGGCGEEAMRIVKNLKFKAPGYRFDGSVPVKFSLPKSGS